MKKNVHILLLIALSAIACLPAFSQTLEFDWAKQISNSWNIRGTCITTDNAGNLISTGWHGGTTDFDPGPATLNFVYPNNYNIFVQKLDAAGNLCWAQNFGTTGNQKGHAVATDETGNIYVTGSVEGTVDFGPGPGAITLTSAGGSDVFIVKLSPEGQVMWAELMGGTLADAGQAIKLDVAGNIYLSGYFTGTADLDPGSDLLNFTSNGGSDIFFTKLDVNGNLLWTRQVGGLKGDDVKALTLDNNNDVYATGTFIGTVDFNPGPGVYSLTATTGYSPDFHEDFYALKLTSGGNFVWATKTGGIYSDWGLDILSDGGTYVYTATGLDIYSPTSHPKVEKIMIRKVNAGNGSIVWSKTIATGGIGGRCLARDADGNIYFAGAFKGTVDFDPGSGVSNLTSNNEFVDCYLLKLNTEGTFNSVKQFKGGGEEYPYSMTFDNNHNLFITGEFGFPVDFDPGAATYYLYDGDLFFLKFRSGSLQGCNPPQAVNATGITNTSAVISWTTEPGVIDYTGQYRLYNIIPDDWQTFSGNSPITLNGLIPGGLYEYQVRKNCGGSFSGWSTLRGFSTVLEGCSDNYEPNETLSQANSIANDIPVTGMITSMTDIDWFKIVNSIKRNTIQIALSNLPADYNISLHKATGTQVGISENYGLADETITYTNAASGTYYIKVWGRYNTMNTTSCYTLMTHMIKSMVAGLEEPTTGLTLYPNPAFDKLYVEYTSDITDNLYMQITDITGRVMIQHSYIATEGTNTYPVDLKELPDGICFFIVNSSSQRYSRKIIVIHGATFE